MDKSSLLQLIENHNNFHTTTYLQALTHIFDDFDSLMDLHYQQQGDGQEEKISLLNQISQLSDRLQESETIRHQLNQKIEGLQLQGQQSLNSINNLVLQIENLNHHRQQSAEQQELQKKQLRSQENLITNLQKELKSLDSEKKSLTELIIKKERAQKEHAEQLQQAQQHNANLENSLAEYKRCHESVLNSRSWKFISGVGTFKRSLFDQPINLFSRSYHIITKMGPAEFLKRLRKKISQRYKSYPKDAYARWIQQNEPTSKDLKKFSAEQSKFQYRPLISIIVPVYNVEEKWLRLMFQSVLNQVYPKWELCLADDASTSPHIKKILNQYKALDNRIKVTFRSQNGGIVAASNSALNLAKGAYIALLDHDDELSPDALYQVVKALQEKKYDLIYSDEDKLELDGTRVEPNFKPDWNPDLLFSNNYICHLGVYRRKIIEEIGRFREGTMGSQDYDLVLRFTEKKRAIKHIPKILYHWRKIPQSTAATLDVKPYVFDAAKNALKNTLSNRGIKATVEDGIWKSSYRVKRHIDGQPLVTIIIPFKDLVDALRVALNSIFEKSTYPNYEILLINNRSEMLETLEYLKEIKNCPRVRVLEFDQPFNFSAINNFAATHANGEYLLLLNNDTEVIEPDWIQNMLEHAQRPEVGAVGAKLLYFNNTVQHAGVIIGVAGIGNHAFCKFAGDHHGYFGQINTIRNYSAVTAACMMVRKDLYQKINGLNEDQLAVSFNDIDFCLRLREQGYLIVYTPYALLYHHESLTRGYNVNMQEEIYIRERHANILKNGDPYYNPNLTRERLDFSLRSADAVQD